VQLLRPIEVEERAQPVEPAEAAHDTPELQAIEFNRARGYAIDLMALYSTIGGTDIADLGDDRRGERLRVDELEERAVGL